MNRRPLLLALALALLPLAASAAAPLSWQTQGPTPVRLGPAAYPRTAVDAAGDAVILAAPPERVVSLEYETDEYVYRVVPAARVVGVSALAYEPKVSNVLDLVGRHRPAVAGDIETILRLQPDLVIASVRSRPELVYALTAAKIPVFRLPTLATELPQVAEIITTVGYLSGEDAAASRERARFEAELADVAAQCAPPHPAARIFGVSMIGYTFGDRTLFHDVVRLVSATNVAAENGIRTYEKIGSETVLRWNPEWVFSWSDPGGAAIERRRWADDPALGAVAAVAQGRLVISDGKDFLPLSPEITKLAHILANHLCKAAP